MSLTYISFSAYRKGTSTDIWERQTALTKEGGKKEKEKETAKMK